GARGRGPDGGVTGNLLRAEVRADRDQLREVVDRVDRAALLDAHEAVRVEIVAEQKRRVAVLRCKQPRPPVVQQVALVDRLDPERIALLAELREDGLALLFLRRPKRG